MSAEPRFSAHSGGSVPVGRRSAPGRRRPSLSGCVRDYSRGVEVAQHEHAEAQLIYAVEGVMRVKTPHGLWVVPPSRAVWVPPFTAHSLRASTSVRLRTLYLTPIGLSGLPTCATVVGVSPLLRELILRYTAIDGRTWDASLVDHAAALILAEIRAFEVRPISISMPNDGRLRKVCQAILDDPASARTCTEWGAVAGASARTLERLFRKEMQISFGLWRRQVRLLEALERLAEGAPVTNVALDLGYRSPSAFTVMFVRALGQLPSEIYAKASQSSDQSGADAGSATPALSRHRSGGSPAWAGVSEANGCGM